jgi:hypothetical protein
MITEKAEQSICIKFCQKLRQSCSETYNMMQMGSGKEEMGHSQVKKQFMCFKEERMSVKSDEVVGRLSTSSNQLMIKWINGE